ncbi:MAG: hypothetical protein ACYDA6_06455 [Solirubrobacteraceae bacterium]
MTDRTDSASAPEPRRLSPEEARIVARFKRLGPQQRALALALRPFTGDQGNFDRVAWAQGFGSDDPEVIYRVIGVTGSFQSIVNHMIEMLHIGARLAGLAVTAGPEKPSAPSLIAAVKEDRGLTANQAEVLTRLYRTRNDLQHASLDVQADQVYEDVALLRKTLARFAKSYVVWMERHHVHLLPGRP